MIGNMDEQRIKKGRMSGLENVSKRKVGTLGRRLSQEVRLSRHKVQQSNQRRGQTGHPQKASMERKGRLGPEDNTTSAKEGMDPVYIHYQSAASSESTGHGSWAGEITTLRTRVRSRSRNLSSVKKWLALA